MRSMPKPEQCAAPYEVGVAGVDCLLPFKLAPQFRNVREVVTLHNGLDL